MGKFTSGEEVHYAEINEIGERIREGKVSPGEVVKASLERIEELDPKLNAFITVLADEALGQAKAAEREIKAGDWRGPLHGIPVGIKDFYDTAGVKTTAAFEHFKDRVPAKDAAGVAKLKQTGAIIIGKMNMHELGMGTTALVGYYGPVHNPWDSQHIASGCRERHVFRNARYRRDWFLSLARCVLWRCRFQRHVWPHQPPRHP